MHTIQEDGGFYLLTPGFVRLHMDGLASPDALAHLVGLARSALTRRESAISCKHAAAASAALSELLCYARMACTLTDLENFVGLVCEADPAP